MIPVYSGCLPIPDMKDFQNAQPGNYQVKVIAQWFLHPTIPRLKRARFILCGTISIMKTKMPLHYIRDKKRTGALRYKDLIFSY